MKYLAVDYGLKKVGLAYAETPLSEPLGVIRNSGVAELAKAIATKVQELSIDIVVVGVPEGKTRTEVERFIEVLREQGMQVETVDETLTTHDAQQFSIAAGHGPKKRKSMEDAYAAAIILDHYLEGHS